MLLNDLPDDILSLVFRISPPHFTSRRDAFKAGLSLLSICRRWRQLAIPMVYDYAYVQYGAAIVQSADSAASDSGRSEPDNVLISTNLELVVAAGCASLVRRVAVDVFCLTNPFPGYRAVIQRMRAVADTWMGVRALELAKHPGQTTLDERDTSNVSYDDDVCEICESLTAMLPSVRELRLGGFYRDYISREASGKLATRYAEQLQVLCSSHPIAVPHDRPFTRIRHVEICGSSVDGYRIPRINPSSIEYIKLDGFPANHLWTAFSTDSSSQVIEFPRLRTLRAIYSGARDNSSDESRTDGCKMVLRFPALKNLSVWCGEPACPLLENAVLPLRMESVTLGAHSSVYHSIASISLPATRRLSLRIPNQVNSDSAVLVTASSLLARAGGCQKKELDIRDRLIPVLPENIGCAGLTRLVVAAQTSVALMICFIRRLPRLTSLTFDRVALEGFQYIISIPERVEHEPLSPLDTNISELSITMYQLPSPEAGALVAKYLLLKLPTLASLALGGFPEQPIVTFVGEYSHWYPHLATVDIQFCVAKSNWIF